MAHVLTLTCSLCGRDYSPDEVAYTCPACGEVGTLDVLYDYNTLRRSVSRDSITASGTVSMWRYRALLPLGEGSAVPPVPVGMTPLIDAPRLAAALDLRKVWVKDEGRNPTGSLKDRASALIVARALEAGIDVISTASTGNAAAALAGMCASVGRVPVIFVPASAPEAKIAQLLVYGAQVLLVEADYDTAFDLCTQMCREQGWYCRNTGINPYTAEGKKTAAFELSEALGWQVPDCVIVSVGDGNIIAGMHKGFMDLLRLGWISRIPRLIGVQAEGSSPLVRAWRKGTQARDMQPEPATTLADSISAGLPRDRAKALRAVRETDGAFVAVSDDEIIASIPPLARLSGVFAEPAAAAAYAGARRARDEGFLSADDRVALLVTGSGLKDVRRAQQSVGAGVRVAPEADAVRRAVQHLRNS